jgi:branched-chain amino acid transport system substrate-binding protein
MTRMRLLSGTALVAVALSVAGCTTSGPEPQNGSVSEVRIGVLAPESGPSRAAGSEALRGAELAAALVNGDEGPVQLAGAGTAGLAGLGGAKLSIVQGDTKSSSDVGATEAARLVTEQKVAGLVGAYDPPVTDVASQRTERLGVPFVNGDSSADFLTERGLDWFFRTGPTDRMFAESFYSALRETAGADASKVAILSADDQPSSVVAQLTRELADEGGFDLTPPNEVKVDPSNAGRTAAAVGSIRDQPQKPDAVFVVASAPGDATALLKAFGEARYSPPGILAFGAGFSAPTVLGAGPDGEDLLTSTSWSREIAGRNAPAKPVMELYEERFNQPMTETAAGTFTAVLVLAQAIDNAGSTDPQRVRAALLNLDIPARETIMPWSGIRFDATSRQNVAANGVVEQRVSQAFRVVFPGELQQAEPQWPRPSPGA